MSFSHGGKLKSESRKQKLFSAFGLQICRCQFLLSAFPISAFEPMGAEGAKATGNKTSESRKQKVEMTQEEFDNHPGWRWCTAQGARDYVLLLGLQSTFREKLEWLEQAEEMVLRMRAGREAREGVRYPGKPEAVARPVK